jgi:UDP-perosamine 4-acetyltransferase
VEIILVGASKKARLVLNFLSDEGSAGRVIGFADRNPALWNTTMAGKPVLGSLESVLERTSRTAASFCICLSERFFADRAEVRTLLDESGFSSISLISEHADVSSSAIVAHGSILFPGARVGMNARVGTSVTIYTGALVEHDCIVSDNVEIASRAVIAGGVRVESMAFIGINATVLPHVVIGAGAIVGGGAVVTKDVDSGTIVAGNPARVLNAATH